MMVFSDYAKLRIVFFHGEGHGPNKIVQLLAREGISASKTGIAKFLERYRGVYSEAERQWWKVEDNGGDKEIGGRTNVTRRRNHRQSVARSSNSRRTPFEP